jgi:hypothetical protein
MTTPKQNNFEHTIVKIFKNERIDKKNRFDLRIVKWKTAKSPSIEKRRIWEREGTDMFRKMAGLNYDDVKFIVDNSTEILSLLKGDNNA